MTNKSLLIAIAILFTIGSGLAECRGFGGGGGRGGGGMRGGGAGFSGGNFHAGGGRSAAFDRTPSVSPRVAERRSIDRSNVREGAASRAADRVPRGDRVAQRPNNIQRPGNLQVPNNIQRPANVQRPSQRPSRDQVQNFLGQGGISRSDLAKVGVGAAAGALTYEGARQLLGERPLDRVGERPTTLPGFRPGEGGEAQRPGGGDRPNIGDRPGGGDRPNIGDRPGGDRPGGDRPGIADRPGGDRPGGDRPGIADRPGSDRPGIGDRPGQGGRPNLTDRRPDNRFNNINVNNIRTNIQINHNNVFTPQWWRNHPNAAHARWHYNHPWHYWWRPAVWAGVTGFVLGAAWSQPIYFDYGDTIYYSGDQVFQSGAPVGSVQEYYDQASALATSAPAVGDLAEGDVMPLGVFAVTQEKAADSNLLLQLALTKEAVIIGTYFNISTDVARPIKGKVDKQSQRAAWTFDDGKDTDIIMETGIYNLTQDQTQVLVHFGPNNTQTWLLIRMQDTGSPDQAQSTN